MSVVQNWLGFGAVVRGDREQVRQGGGKGAIDTKGAINTRSIYLTPYKLYGTANQIKSNQVRKGSGRRRQHSQNKRKRRSFHVSIVDSRRVLHPSQTSTIPYHIMQHPSQTSTIPCHIIQHPSQTSTIPCNIIQHLIVRWYAAHVSKPRWLGSHAFTSDAGRVLN